MENNLEIVWFNDLNYQKADTVTDSLVMAKEFEKEHKHILEKIRDIEKDLGNLDLQGIIDKPNFRPTNYTDSQNREKPKYELNEDAVMLLIMRLSGEKALKIQLRFIAEFKRMKEELRSIKHARVEGIPCRHSLTDAIKDYVKYEDCPYNKFAYVTNFAYLVLFNNTAKQLKDMYNVKDKEGLRNYLDNNKLNKISRIEDEIAVLLQVLPVEEVKQFIYKKYGGM
jgi:Rha family phage regulatory protein